MSYKTRDGKTHQSTVLMGDNGLPIDGIATIAGSYVFLEVAGALTYVSGSATVTLPVGSDLTDLSTARARYTGRYVLITADGAIYYINRQSIDIGARTFNISRSDSSQINPVAIDLLAGWKVAEADIVNRMATTSAAKIDVVEFRDLQFQMQLDGDPVTLLNQNGVGINPATEEKQDVIISELGLVNDELDTITITLNQIDDTLNKTYVASPTIINTSMPIAGTEYQVVLPSTLKRFILKARLPTSLEYRYVSAGSYLTLKPGSLIEENNIDRVSSLTIYIISAKPNTVIETVYWE